MNILEEAWAQSQHLGHWCTALTVRTGRKVSNACWMFCYSKDVGEEYMQKSRPSRSFLFWNIKSTAYHTSALALNSLLFSIHLPHNHMLRLEICEFWIFCLVGQERKRRCLSEQGEYVNNNSSRDVVADGRRVILNFLDSRTKQKTSAAMPVSQSWCE